jgi:hypothetical protein
MRSPAARLLELLQTEHALADLGIANTVDAGDIETRCGPDHLRTGRLIPLLADLFTAAWFAQDYMPILQPETRQLTRTITAITAALEETDDN